MTWEVKGAKEVSLDQGIGAVTGTSRSVSPAATTTYTLTATNGSKRATRQVTVIVEAPGAPVIATFSAAPATIEVGETSTLSWSVTGATSLSIDQGVGAVTGGASIEVSPEETTTYTLTATNASGSATRQVTVFVNEPGAPAIASFTATPSTVASGGTSELRWSVAGATSLSIDQGVGAVTGGASIEVSPEETTTYTLTATNASGSATRQVTVFVNEPGAPAIASFTATPSTVASGGTSELRWSVAGATSLSIDQGVGAVTGGASIEVSPEETTTYTLTATNASGSATRQVTVFVNEPGAPAIASFTATPSTVASGGTSELRWSVTGATSLSIDQGVGTVTGGASIEVSPEETTTYTLTAANASGSSTRQVTVKVAASPPVIASFTASPATIVSGGSSTLSWSVTGATTIRIDPGIGAVAETSRAVGPTATTIYTLTATNASGNSTRQVTVNVAAAGAPVIASFTASPSTVALGQSSTLSWRVTGATQLYIFPADCSTTVTRCEVSPKATTTYVLTASNSAGSVSEKATVNVAIAPTPWLHTKGNKIYVSAGQGEDPVWVGRGVNMDDLFLSGHTEWPDTWIEEELKQIGSQLVETWKPSFVRISLNMFGYSQVSWLRDPEVYKVPMVNVINGVGAHADVYALVTLRSDASMRYCNGVDDAICLPASGTDAVYRALVDSFKDAPFVMFGVSNEPGGMSATDQEIFDAMRHAVEVIRTREDELGVPHHIVAVQGNSWTSDLSFYDRTPIPFDNVVYEYHAFPPRADGSYGYTHPSLPVIIGAYGPPLTSDLPDAESFFADVEAKQIPTLAWIFSPYNTGKPNLLQATHSSFDLIPTAWGTRVQTYLTQHAR